MSCYILLQRASGLLLPIPSAFASTSLSLIAMPQALSCLLYSLSATIDTVLTPLSCTRFRLAIDLSSIQWRSLLINYLIVNYFNRSFAYNRWSASGSLRRSLISILGSAHFIDLCFCTCVD